MPSILDQHGGSLDLPKEIKGKDAFKTYNRRQLSASSLLSGSKMPGIDDKDTSAPTLSALLQQCAVPGAAAAFNAALQGAFTLPAAQRQAASTQFERDFKLLEDAVKAVPPRIKIRDLSGFLGVMQADALAAIKADQDAELTQLKTFLTTAPGNAQLATAFNLDATAAAALAQHLIQKLEDSHTKQMEDFKSAIEKSQEELRKNIAKDRARIAFLVNADKEHKNLNKQIDAFERNNTPPAAAAGIQLNRASSRYKKLKPSNLQGHVTVTGRGIKKDGESYSLDAQAFPNTRRMLNKIRGKDKDELDILGVAALIRAEGCETIEYVITGSEDQARCYELARSAYKACILAGFPPDKITIKWVNPKDGKTEVLAGKLDSKTNRPAGEMLFQSDALGKVLAATHKKGEHIRAEEANEAKPSASTAELRQKLTVMRAAAAPPPAGPVPAAPPIAPGP